MNRRTFVAASLAAALLFAACGDDSGTSGADGATSSSSGGSTATSSSGGGEQVTLRLGYFPNITHATALVGVGKGIFAEKLGSNVKLETATFNVGTKAVEAMFSDAIDATYVGPNPAINAYAQSKGDAVRIVSGATSGGAFFVVKPEISSAADLKGKTVASPGLGGTQDVALRSWLADQGLKTDTAGGGDVKIAPQENAQTLESFIAGTIQGAWVPEPWATRLVKEGGGKVLVDESTLWPGGKYVTTHLMVSKKFLDKHPDVVKRLIEGQIAANDFVNANADEAQKIANDEIEKVTTKRIKDDVMAAAWKNLTFTDDPIASSLLESAKKAEGLGLLKPVDNLGGIYDLSMLNEALKAAGKPEVAAS